MCPGVSEPPNTDFRTDAELSKHDIDCKGRLHITEVSNDFQKDHRLPQSDDVDRTENGTPSKLISATPEELIPMIHVRSLLVNDQESLDDFDSWSLEVKLLLFLKSSTSDSDKVLCFRRLQVYANG